MKIYVTVKPNARKNEVERHDGVHFSVSVQAPPTGGTANEAVVRALADHLGIPKSRITIVRGTTSREKIIEIS